MSIKADMERAYGIAIRRIEPVRDVYRVRTAERAYCLKGYDVPEEEALFLTRVLSILDERGFAYAPKAVATAAQAPFAARGGRYYTLTRWVDGRHPNFADNRDLRGGVRTLAKFHLRAEGFPAAEAPPSRIRYDRLEGELRAYAAQLERHSATARMTSACEEALEALRDSAAQAAIRAERRASSFVHGDYNAPNLIKDRRGKLHLIDFENSSLHVRAKDLSHLLHRNCLWNGQKMLRSVERYDKVRPLSANERHLLYALLIAPYHVVRNLRIGGVASAKRIVPDAARWDAYRRSLRPLLS